jgi:hypothetical protein
MRKQPFLSLIFLSIFSLFINSAKSQEAGPINQARLREILVQLGYTVKDLNTTPGKEKFEVKITQGGLDVPISYEISASTSYVWLTVFLGPAPAEASILNAAMLKQNSKIQPCMFYTTESGNLMMGLPVDNRGLNNALLRRYTDFITTKVVDTKAYWQK